jgi:hypothetical protein
LPHWGIIKYQLLHLLMCAHLHTSSQSVLPSDEFLAGISVQPDTLTANTVKNYTPSAVA